MRGRLTPVACDFKCGFDRDDPRWERLGLPADLFRRPVRVRDRDQPAPHPPGPERRLRHQPARHDPGPTFGGGANSLVSCPGRRRDHLLGLRRQPVREDEGGRRICFKHWLAQSNVLFIIGGKSNNTDIFTTFRAMGDALREHFSAHGPTPLYVVVGRGGPKLIAGMGRCRTRSRPWACPTASASIWRSARSSTTRRPPTAG